MDFLITLHVTTLVHNWVGSIRALEKCYFLPFCLLFYLLWAA